jgi:hypothetical protein
MFTAAELMKIARRQGPSVHGLARRVATFIDLNPDDQVKLREIVAWLVSSGDSVNVRVAMEDNNAEKVRTAIAGKHRIDGNPFPEGELVPYRKPQLVAA